jgi:fatty-acid desaturase
MTFNQKLITLVLIHVVLFLNAVVFNFSWWMLLSAYLLGKLFNMLGHEIGLHRLWSHASFKTSILKENILHLFAIPILFGSPIVYSAVHRDHHRNADTDKDPHLESMWAKLFYKRRSNYLFKVKLILDLLKDPKHKFIHDNYLLINSILLILMLILFGPIYTGWTLSAIVVYMWIGGLLINSLGHQPENGYRNFETNDKSSNNKFLQYTFPGIGLHNNHHAHQKEYNLAMKPGEFDLTGWVIKRFFKL